MTFQLRVLSCLVAALLVSITSAQNIFFFKCNLCYSAERDISKYSCQTACVLFQDSDMRRG